MSKIYDSINEYQIETTSIITLEQNNYIFNSICWENQGEMKSYFVKVQKHKNKKQKIIGINNSSQEILVLEKIKKSQPKFIIQIKDIIHKGDVSYIIMENYFTTLYDRITLRRQQNQPFETYEILEMFRQILQGSKYLQQAGIVHDNITQNIMFKDGTYKFINFSNARLVDTNEFDKMTLFKLGCVLYEMASLKPLFQARSSVDYKLAEQVFYNNSKNNQIKINQITLPDSKKRAQLIRQLLTLTIVEHNTNLQELESLLEQQYHSKGDQLTQLIEDQGLNQYFLELEKYQRYKDYDFEIFEERNKLNCEIIEDKFKLIYLCQIGYLYLQERQLALYNSRYRESVQSNMYYYWLLMRILFIYAIISIAEASIQLLQGHLNQNEIYFAVDQDDLNFYQKKKLQTPSAKSNTSRNTTSTKCQENDQETAYIFSPLTNFEDNLHLKLTKMIETLRYQLNESFKIINKGIKPIQTKCTLMIYAEIGDIKNRRQMGTSQIMFFIRELYIEKKENIQEVMDLHNKYYYEEYSLEQLEHIINELKQCNIKLYITIAQASEEQIQIQQ